VAQKKSWSWVTAKESLANFSYLDWCLDPMCCMKYLKKIMLCRMLISICPRRLDFGDNKPSKKEKWCRFLW